MKVLEYKEITYLTIKMIRSLTLQVPLRYLIGALHINFKLLWEPLTKLIASHAAGLDKTVFWELYRQTLQDAAHKCGKTKISVVRVRKYYGYDCYKIFFLFMLISCEVGSAVCKRTICSLMNWNLRSFFLIDTCRW